MTVLLTGSAGFIGFHAAAALLRRGERVVGVDNLCPYYPVVIKRARLARLEQHANFTQVVADLADEEAMRAVFQKHQPKRVLHLGAQAGVRYSISHPDVYVRSNLVGFANVIEQCRRAEVERLVYASSSSVYGGNTRLPFSVNDPVDRPISLYAATKRSNELAAHVSSHLFGLPTVGLRFFTVYGPYGRPDMAMWIFAEKILAGVPIPLFNNGDMRRDFTYVDDIVAGVLAALDTPDLDAYELFNLGGDHPEDLLDVVRLLEEALGKPARRDLLPMQPGDVPATWANIDGARAKLGFSPGVRIEDGVARFVDWYRAHPDLAQAAREARATGDIP